jgi:predicted nucleic acid-binding protein
MSKPTVYLDTTVISAYWYEGHDVLSLSRRILTREWWEDDRREFRIWISRITLAELQAGRYRRQVEACEMARRIRLLPMNHTISRFAETLASAGIVPRTKPNDALQMAVASVHHIDYLLTWNYAHLANPNAQLRLDNLCSEAGHRAPIMVTAESVPRSRRGQSIRRD